MSPLSLTPNYSTESLYQFYMVHLLLVITGTFEPLDLQRLAFI